MFVKEIAKIVDCSSVDCTNHNNYYIQVFLAVEIHFFLLCLHHNKPYRIVSGWIGLYDGIFGIIRWRKLIKMTKNAWAFECADFFSALSYTPLRLACEEIWLWATIKDRFTDSCTVSQRRRRRRPPNEFNRNYYNLICTVCRLQHAHAHIFPANCTKYFISVSACCFGSW